MPSSTDHIPVRADVDGLRAGLLAGRRLLTTFVTVPRVEVCHLAAIAGFDGVIVDLEHGQIGLSHLVDLASWSHDRGLVVLSRVPEVTASWVGRSLDAGVDGILAAHIDSVASAQRLVSLGRFVGGQRGVNPFVPSGDYGSADQFYSKADAEIALIAMVEGVEGLSAIADIATVDGLDGIFLGPYDLSASLGVPGEVADPRVIAALTEASRVAQASGIACGAFATDAKSATQLVEFGISFVALSVDTAMALEGFRAHVRGVRADF